MTVEELNIIVTADISDVTEKIRQAQQQLTDFQQQAAVTAVTVTAGMAKPDAANEPAKAAENAQTNDASAPREQRKPNPQNNQPGVQRDMLYAAYRMPGSAESSAVGIGNAIPAVSLSKEASGRAAEQLFLAAAQQGRKPAERTQEAETVVHIHVELDGEAVGEAAARVLQGRVLRYNGK